MVKTKQVWGGCESSPEISRRSLLARPKCQILAHLQRLELEHQFEKGLPQHEQGLAHRH